MLLTILYFFLALGILVTFHEFGHFYVARRCGVKVLRFSVGFGKTLVSWTGRTGTEYALAAIPLGGYVKMLDERGGDVAPDQLIYAFSQKTVWQRIAIVAAGPIANFILAIGLYFVLALSGTQGVVPVVGSMPVDSLVAEAGLREGDEILAVDGEPVQTWAHVFSRLLRRIGDTGDITLTVVTFSYASGSTEVARSSRMVKVPINHWLYDAEEPDLFQSLGLVQFVPDMAAIVDRVVGGSAADLAGIEAGDKILRADNNFISSWQAWVDYVRARADVSINLVVERGGERRDLMLTPRRIVQEDGSEVGQAGVSVAVVWPNYMVREIEYGVLGSLVEGVRRTGEQASFILSFIKKLVTADVSTKNLSGTFTIAQAAGDSAQAGLSFYLAFLAYLSVSLGVLNLLPIPVLDGGHLLYYVVEAIKGSPVSEKIQLVGYQIGLVCILSVMVLAHVNDIRRLFF
ncbi:RIP metalloprotease RseP [Eionea flava]